ncbi:MAG: class I SAM-dependent methyltransferase [Acidimicrobiaceae bacterium]|nr:class I SAM-dependent methyltransferase [Acidimicrobiaceae bacterium]MBO0746729.1 class I SAM-dependent methyltransferase [Acidimicrobiaceae bacterium]
MTDTGDTNAAIWKSDENLAYWLATQDARERRRAEQRLLLADLLPFGDHEPFTFVDLGAGTGAAARVILDRFPASFGLLAEYSPQMTEEGTRSLAPYEGRFRYVEFDLGADAWPSEIPEGLGAAISSLVVHHLPDRRKQELFGEIWARLAPGGWYLNYEAVAAGDPIVEEAWQRANDRADPTAAEKRAHRTPEEQFRYENHVRYMIPLTPQLDFLADAGFEAIDVYWKNLDYVIYGGRRPPSSGS